MTTLPPPSPGPECPRYAPLLPLLHAGEINPRDRDAVLRHLNTCAWCARQLAGYDTLAAAMRRHFGGAIAPTSLPSVETMLHDVTHREELVFEETPTCTTPLTQATLRRRTLPSIAATLFIVVLGLLLF